MIMMIVMMMTMIFLQHETVYTFLLTALLKRKIFCSEIKTSVGF